MTLLNLTGQTGIAGLCLAVSRRVSDERGEFARLFDADLLAPVHAARPIVQVNRSVTRQPGSVRGLHFQRAPALEAKWVRCLRGRVFDVIVDLRAGSPTFARWHAVELSDQNQRQVLIPPGCAHGFQTRADHCELLYQHSAAYAPQCEDGVRHDDPRLAIVWPEPVTEQSPRDRGFALLSADFKGVRI